MHLLTCDASGRSWLPALLAATPSGGRRLGSLLESPGWLISPLAVPAASGRLACFEYPATPPRELLAWFIDHPGELVWPASSKLSAETVRLRRSLLMNDPPGSQARAQERARELLPMRSPFSRAWWRFEEVSKLDCILITDRLERVLPESAPHLDDAGREELLAAYLGNVTWRVACDAVDFSYDAFRRRLGESSWVMLTLVERGGVRPRRRRSGVATPRRGVNRAYQSSLRCRGNTR